MTTDTANEPAILRNLPFTPSAKDPRTVRIYDKYLAVLYHKKWWVVERWNDKGQERSHSYFALLKHAQQQHLDAGGSRQKRRPKVYAKVPMKPEKKVKAHANREFKALHRLSLEDREVLRTLTGTLVQARIKGVKSLEKFPIPTDAIYTTLRLAYEGLGIDIRTIVPQVDFSELFK
jgi:hypothetical protein